MSISDSLSERGNSVPRGTSRLTPTSLRSLSPLRVFPRICIPAEGDAGEHLRLQLLQRSYSRFPVSRPNSRPSGTCSFESRGRGGFSGRC